VDPLAGVRDARSVARVRGGRDSPAGVSATKPLSFYFASTICGFASCAALRSGLNAGFAVNAGALGMRMIGTLPVVQRSARGRAAALAQNAIATKGKATLG